MTDGAASRGIGKHLLQHALNDAHDLGCRRAGISMAWDNHRAFVFYSNFGCSVSAWAYGWHRDL